MNAFESFTMYHSLKLHFKTKDYDYIKFSGKNSYKYPAFKNRKDQYVFEKLAKIHKSYLYDFYISVFSYNTVPSYSQELLSIGYEESLKQRLEEKEAATELFRKDLIKLRKHLKEGNTFRSLCLPKKYDLPTLVFWYEEGYIKLNTLSIIHQLTRFTERVESLHFLWEDKKLFIEKYSRLNRFPNMDELGKMLRTSIE